MTTPDTAQLIETMRVETGHRTPLRHLHMIRLQRSCEALDFQFPDTLDAALDKRIARLDRQQCHRLRILTSRDGMHTIETSVLPASPPSFSLLLARVPREADRVWSRHKSTYRPWYDAASKWLDNNPDVFDLVYCDANEKVCEGSRTNIYIRDAAGRWLTPPVELGVLPGVQRQALLDQGLVHEAPISRRELLQAKEIRLSNALRGWVPATLVRDYSHIGA